MQHASQNGNNDATMSLASYYSTGYGCKKNVYTAIELEKKMYSLGANRFAAYNLGCSYRLLQKYRLAWQWFKKSYIDDKDAAFDLGKCYLFGQGVKKNTTLALQYFRETTNIKTFPTVKIHAMKLIADIQCGLPPTSKPLRSKRMTVSLMKKYAQCYQEELRRNPENEAACWCLSQLYCHHKRFKEALPYLQKCHQLSFCPEDIIPWLSSVYYELGMFKEEVEIYRSCLQSNPKDKWAKRRLKFALKDLVDSDQAVIG
jgi:TPR repeat protein